MLSIILAKPDLIPQNLLLTCLIMNMWASYGNGECNVGTKVD